MERVSRVLGTLQSIAFLSVLVSLIVLLAGILVEPTPYDVRPLAPGSEVPGPRLRPPVESTQADAGSTPAESSLIVPSGTFVSTLAVATESPGEFPAGLRSGGGGEGGSEVQGGGKDASAGKNEGDHKGKGGKAKGGKAGKGDGKSAKGKGGGGKGGGYTSESVHGGGKTNGHGTKAGKSTSDNAGGGKGMQHASSRR